MHVVVPFLSQCYQLWGHILFQKLTHSSPNCRNFSPICGNFSPQSNFSEITLILLLTWTSYKRIRLTSTKSCRSLTLTVLSCASGIKRHGMGKIEMLESYAYEICVSRTVQTNTKQLASASGLLQIYIYIYSNCVYVVPIMTYSSCPGEDCNRKCSTKIIFGASYKLKRTNWTIA